MRSLPLALTFVLLAPGVASAAWPGDPATDLVVCGEAAAQWAPRACSDGTGGMILVWQDQRTGSNPVLYAQRVDGTGTLRWAAGGVAVCTRPGINAFAGIVSDGAGGAIVAWQNALSARRVFAQRLDPDGNALWDAQGRRVCTLEANQDDPFVVSDDAGGAIVTWTDARGANASQRPIYGQRLDPSGARLWGTHGDSLTVRGSKTNVAVCPDGEGGLWLAWSDVLRRPLAQRVFPSGATGPAVELTPAAFSNQAYQLQIAPAGDGGAIVGVDYHGTTRTLWAQKAGAAGTLPWGTTPVLVCDAGTDQIDARLVSDGAGGAILGWTSLVLDPEMRVQRVDASGATRWTANGVTVWTHPTSAFKFGMAADGAGGVVISAAVGDSGQRAYRTSASGLPMWGPDGVHVSRRGANTFDPVVLAQPDGGALVAWTGTITDVDLLAGRLFGNGSHSTVDAPVTVAGLRLSVVGENPVRGAARFAFALPAAGDATVEVFDVQGRATSRRALGALGAGRHTLTLEAHELPAGVAFVRLTSAAGAASARVVRLR